MWFLNVAELIKTHYVKPNNNEVIINLSFFDTGPVTLPWSRHACWSWLFSWSATWLCVVHSRVSPMSTRRMDWPLTTSSYGERRVCFSAPCWRKCRRTKRAEPVSIKQFCPECAPPSSQDIGNRLCFYTQINTILNNPTENLENCGSVY